MKMQTKREMRQQRARKQRTTSHERAETIAKVAEKKDVGRRRKTYRVQVDAR